MPFICCACKPLPATDWEAASRRSRILQTVLHSLAVCNQACVDTRKMDQMLTLAKLPAGFAETVDRIITSFDPPELLSACETLLGSNFATSSWLNNASCLARR